MAYPEPSAAGGSLADRLGRPVKRVIAGQVVALFNDTSRGERPVPRRTDGLAVRAAPEGTGHPGAADLPGGGAHG